MIDATELIVRAIPAGHPVLLIGDGVEAVAAALCQRGSTCRCAGVDALLDLAAVSAGGPVFSVAIVNGFGRIAHPVDTLSALGALVPPEGSVLIVADNASHLATRLTCVEGGPAPAPAGAGAGAAGAAGASGGTERLYQLSSLRRCIAASGLRLQGLLRVIRPIDDTVEAELRLMGLGRLVDQPEASTVSYVAVTARQGAAGGPGPGLGVAEYLQAEVDDLVRQLALERRRASALADRVAEPPDRAATDEVIADLGAQLARALTELDQTVVERDRAETEVARLPRGVGPAGV